MKVPVTIISGFLGSGKTSLINKIIEANSSTKFGLILNEFGESDLESKFIEQKDIKIQEFPSGCMCHVPQGDIARAIDEILAKMNIDHIIIEASGLTDPFFVAMTLSTEELSSKVFLRSIITVVDSENYLENSKKKIFDAQLDSADLVFVSKTNGEIDNSLIEFIKSKIKTNLIYSTQEQKVLSLIINDDSLNFQSSDTSKYKENRDDHSHDEFEKVYIEIDGFLEKLEVYNILNKLSNDIVRVKGYFNWGYESDKLYLVNGVGKRIRKYSEKIDKEEKPKAAFLFIGNNLDKDSLEKQFQKATWKELDSPISKILYFLKVKLSL